MPDELQVDNFYIIYGARLKNIYIYRKYTENH